MKNDIKIVRIICTTTFLIFLILAGCSVIKYDPEVEIQELKNERLLDSLEHTQHLKEIEMEKSLKEKQIEKGKTVDSRYGLN